MNDKIQVGDMVMISVTGAIRGKKSAISAWTNKRKGRNLFSIGQPEKSEDYAQWFEELSNSVGYCCDIDDDWIQISFVHLQTPIWFMKSILKKV